MPKVTIDPAGKLELVTVEFDLRTVLEDALDSVAGRAMMKAISKH